MTWLRDSWVLSNVVLPILDIAFLSYLFYKSYQILLQTRAIQLIKGVVFLLLLFGLAFILDLKTLLWVLNLIAPGLVVGIAIIFQPELRKIFTRIGQGQLFRIRARSRELPLEEILKSAESLSASRRGALIVFTRNVGLKNIIETGSRLDAEISMPLIMSIFAFDTALHDGAVIIENGRISSAGSFLPLSEQQDIRKSFGTRHRAALGIVEDTDAVVLVVSEETGAISLAYDAGLFYNLEVEELRKTLRELLQLKGSEGGEDGNEE